MLVDPVVCVQDKCALSSVDVPFQPTLISALEILNALRIPLDLMFTTVLLTRDALIIDLASILTVGLNHPFCAPILPTVICAAFTLNDEAVVTVSNNTCAKSYIVCSENPCSVRSDQSVIVNSNPLTPAPTSS